MKCSILKTVFIACFITQESAFSSKDNQGVRNEHENKNIWNMVEEFGIEHHVKHWVLYYGKKEFRLETHYKSFIKQKKNSGYYSADLITKQS